MKTKIILTFAICHLTFYMALAQDFHLSQYDAAPHYFNPALTGIYFGEKADYRIYSDYRSQWKALGYKPYSTFYAAYDMPYKLFGLGGYIVNNRNGMTGGFNTMNVMLSGSYKISNEVNTPHNLSVGVQMGILYRAFDPSKFTFDSQYSPDSPTGFDQNLSNGENFGKTSIAKFDANMGVFYKYKQSSWNVHPWGGLAVYHVTQPNQSLTGIQKDKLPMRWVFWGGADWKVNEQIHVTPMILYMNQAKAYEFNFGALGFYNFQDTKYNVIGGLNYRLKDAFIIQAGLQYEQHIFTISYDINTSYLNNYTNSRGGIEFSLILTGVKGKPLINPSFFRKGTSVFKAL